MAGPKIPGKSPVDWQDRRRIIGVALLLGAFFAVLLVQFYFLQIRDGEQWAKKGSAQHFLVLNEPAKRGTFYSNCSLKRQHPEEPQCFVLDIEKFHLHLDPDSVPSKVREEMSLNLSQLLSLEEPSATHLKQQFFRKSRDRTLSMWLDRDTKDAIQSWWMGFAREHRIARNALFFVTDYQRSYPFGKMLGQVLHTLQHTKEKGSDFALPTGGLEYQFDHYLKGKGGKRRLRRSPHHSFELGEVLSSPEPGADVFLTINHVLQAIAEEEIEKGVKRVKGKRGWVVVMEPKTGAILALAQYPFFDPLHYPSYFSNPEQREETRVHAISDALEPGSVMKVISASVALKANEERKEQGLPMIIDPLEKIPTADGKFPGRTKPIRDVSFHHFLNMPMAIQKSSNIYVGRVIGRVIDAMGRDWYRNQLIDTFGFGKKTNIELPGETAGVVPKPGRKHPNGKLEWSTPTPFSLAMGYNLQTNTIQILRAFSVFANGGHLVQPTLVRKIVRHGPQGKEEILHDALSSERLESFPRVLSEGICRQVIDFMKYTMQSGGSGHRGAIGGYTTFGKSSTEEKLVNGQYQKKLHVSMFLGGVVAEDPPFLVAVTIDEPEYGVLPGLGRINHGSYSCAPVFHNVARRSLEYLGIPEDNPFGWPVGDPRRDPEKGHWFSEARQLQEMYEKWNN